MQSSDHSLCSPPSLIVFISTYILLTRSFIIYSLCTCCLPAVKTVDIPQGTRTLCTLACLQCTCHSPYVASQAAAPIDSHSLCLCNLCVPFPLFLPLSLSPVFLCIIIILGIIFIAPFACKQSFELQFQSLFPIATYMCIHSDLT